MSEDCISSRDILLRAAIEAFGQHGRDGASTRQIATAAGMPMSQITYHFGGKDGLYLACAQYIADDFISNMAAAIGHDLSIPQTPAEARVALIALIRTMVHMMLRKKTRAISHFILREQAEPTEAFAIIYNCMMGRAIARVRELLGIISENRLTEAQLNVRTMALIGQVIVFRAANASVLRTTGWSEIGPEQNDEIADAIIAHVNAICDAIE
ncbi:MAG: CerR family C-terminal domain-containing protein, partial [Alphaproteobacteria bacterium]|nr:CerR family C-terminal domain-containing protein [Alphaproteobacteria bacterium]